MDMFLIQQYQREGIKISQFVKNTPPEVTGL
jgi:hypothetical protein